MKKLGILVVSALFIFTACAPRVAQAPAASAGSGETKFVAGGAPELLIDYQLNTAAADSNNYFTFKGPIRYMAAEKDTLDATTGASAKGSTHFFQPYLLDVKGKAAFPSGMRGLFLFAVGPFASTQNDNLTVAKAADGVITVQFAHRGTAYKIVTDAQGKLSFPIGSYQKRGIGFIQGAGPQVISTDFSSDGTAAGIDWAKVWDSSIAGGKEIQAGVTTKTGAIVSDGVAPDSMFWWNGDLQFTYENSILTIKGSLSSAKR